MLLVLDLHCSCASSIWRSKTNNRTIVDGNINATGGNSGARVGEGRADTPQALRPFILSRFLMGI
jgi:hypothetical protein